MSRRRYFYVFNGVNHRKKSGKCFIIFNYWEFKLLVQMLQCQCCFKFWTNCTLMIFIVRNGLWILAFITIKIIRYNVFNSFLPSFFSLVNQVGVYLTRGCWSLEVFDCDVIMITKLVKKSCEFLIDFAVLASAVSLRYFEATLLKAVNYCVCRHIFSNRLQSMNCFCNINILHYLRGLFTFIGSRYHMLHKQLSIFTFKRSDYTSIKWMQTRRGYIWVEKSVSCLSSCFEEF